MPTLSASDIKGYAKRAGFTGKDLDIAVAVALAESGGNTKAHNDKPPDDSYGLWQINMLGKMGRDRQKQFKLASYSDLYDPDRNAKAAYAIWKTQGWKDGWTTYSNGDYLKFMSKSETAQPSDKTDDDAIDLNPVDNVTGAINSFSSTIFKGITNMAGIGIAVALLIIGVVLLVVSSKNAQKAVGIAANVIPGGSVVKGAVKKVATG
jgi:hypothetical protein